MSPTADRIGDLVVTCLPTGGWRSNCYIVAAAGSPDAVVIDPGEDAPGIIAELDGRVPSRIICTHGHYDHSGAAERLSHEYGIPCEVHERDRRLLGHAAMYAMTFERRPFEVPSLVATFNDDTVIPLGDLELCVISTPGHTPGSVCLVTDGAVFTGDTLLHRAVGRVDLPGGEPEQLTTSVERLLATLAPSTRLFPGHGAPWLASEARAWWATARGAAS